VTRAARAGLCVAEGPIEKMIDADRGVLSLPVPRSGQPVIPAGTPIPLGGSGGPCTIVGVFRPPPGIRSASEERSHAA